MVNVWVVTELDWGSPTLRSSSMVATCGKGESPRQSSPSYPPWGFADVAKTQRAKGGLVAHGSFTNFGTASQRSTVWADRVSQFCGEHLLVILSSLGLVGATDVDPKKRKTGETMLGKWAWTRKTQKKNEWHPSLVPSWLKFVQIVKLKKHGIREFWSYKDHFRSIFWPQAGTPILPTFSPTTRSRYKSKCPHTYIPHTWLIPYAWRRPFFWRIEFRMPSPCYCFPSFLSIRDPPARIEVGNMVWRLIQQYQPKKVAHQTSQINVFFLEKLTPPFLFLEF